ncbi:MAG: SdrD B-like domain-containing protein [Ferruginibacter sp.]
MKKITTQLNRTSLYSAVLIFLFSALALTVTAHSVTGYTAGCTTGPVYSVQPIVTNVNSSSNYRWQYKNASGTWVCIVNGSNTINGNTYTVSGAVYNLTTNPGPIIFSNTNSNLNGVVIRCVISDGSGVNPCNMPSGNTWNSDANSVNHTINVTNTPCAGGGSIGDRVWYDADGDGIQDASETTGITGVTVQLRNAAGTVISTTSTNSTGYYLFSGLSAGNYTVVFPVSISGAVVTAQHVGTNVDIDSDPSTTTGITQVIALATNQNITNIDAGYCPTTLQLGNRVWYDANNNGLNDSEDGIRGVTMNLYKDDNNDNVADGAAIATTTTDADGYYMFSNLSPGNYIVGAMTPAGYVKSSVNGGDPDNDIDKDNNGSVTVGNETRGLAITLIAGTEYDGSSHTSNTNVTYDFGFLPDCTCTNSAGNLLVNGSFENGTTGWSWSNGALTTGTGFIACGAANGFLQWTSGTAKFWQDVTNANIAAGSTVSFNGYAGTHTAGQSCSPKLSLLFLNSAGTVLSQTDVAITRDVDINHNQLAYYSITAVAPAGTAKVRVQGTITCDWLKLDAFCLTATAPMNLGDKVWYDRNNNGTQDAGEPGVAGATVKLYSDANGDNVPDGAAIATTTTNASGIYGFANIAPGKYIVGVTIPAGYAAGATTATSASPDNDNNTDNNGVTTVSGELRSNFITLTAGGEPTTDGDGANGNLTLDFGLKGTGAIGDFVWNDTNANGLQEGGELGIGNVTVTLTYPDGTTLNTTTTAAGIYAFTNLAPGSYTVTFTSPAGYLVTPSNVGADDNIDSDPVGGVVSGIAINGNTNNTIDAGFYQLGSIGDRVWKDDNGNGIQDAGEVGVAGVTITLYNAAGQVVASTTTDAFGNYLFSKLMPGNYTLKVTPPANYSLSAKTQGADTNLDSDFDPATYTTGTVSLASGQNRTDIDAGLKFTQPSTASVGDRVWLDLNADGVQDAGEPGVSNVLVTLYNSAGTAVRNTYTDVNGLYLFTDVTPGTYTVGVSLPPAFVFTTNSGTVSGATNSDIVPATGRTASFTVNAGDQITYVDAGVKTQVSTNGSIGDYVWNDINKNGIQEAGEPGIAGVTVRLINATTNTVIATTTTDATGKYIFNDVVAGSYQVEFVTPAGYTVTTKLNTDPALSNTDSDVDPGTLRSAVFPLAAGQRIVTIDGGYWLTTPPGTGKIGDYVWYDSNQNGVQDAGEPGVPGVTVVLYDGSGTAIKQTVTDTSGKYIFTDLGAGNYTVGFFNIPAGYTFTTQGAGTAANNSDANPATGKTGVIALAAGQVNLDVDAGIRSGMAGTASIGNFVWNDLNNNGLQDAGEPGIGGVTVELLDANGNSIDSDPATAGVQPTIRVTNALGGYLFTGLPAGDYKVKFSNLPAGFNVVTKGAGTDRNLDSDGNPVVSGATTTDIVSVAAGDERLDIDLGLNNSTVVGQLGDFVWFDSNNNGIQDNGEQGVPGVSVSLLNAAGSVIATTVTDGVGFYKFANLADGSYSVRFSNLPAGFSFSAKDQGADDSKDSDADPATGTTGTYSITGGNANMTVDAGIYSTRAALGDYVWFDANSNGTQDATEKGIPGITVVLYNAAGAAVTSAVTDQNGRYFFSNLNPGTYTVGFSTTPGKLVFTLQDVVAAGDAADSDVDPATGKTGSYTLAAGQVNLTVDAGLKPVIPASIGDFVWYDLNRDGLQTAGEPGVPGVVVTLYNSANQVVGAAITDGNGYYNINNVAPGTGYYLKFSNQPDATAPWTVRYVGGTTAENNSKVDGFGTTDPFSVSEGQHITNLDAGIYKIFNLSGNVWHDVNGMNDGLVNDTRNTVSPPGAPIPTGLRISRVDAVTGKVVAVALVQGNGAFNFPNVAPGTYTLILSPIPGVVGDLAPFASLPSGWINTGEHLGLTPGADPVTNGKLTVTLTTFNVTNANFGIQLNNDDIGIN